MPNTVPNQRLITIHREPAKSDFLGIKNCNWQAAARDLGAHALMLYLYIAANADNYNLALSPVAINQAVGMPASTYRDQFVKLVNKGYLVRRSEGSNIYDFYELPKRVTCSKRSETSDGEGQAAYVDATAVVIKNKTPENREINNIDNPKYIINNNGGEKQVSPAPMNEIFQ